MARKEEPLSRAVNLRKNLRRIFDAWGNQTQIARDAGIHRVSLARLLSGVENNPTINFIEALAGALQISVETLIATDPLDTDLRITPEKSFART